MKRNKKSLFVLVLLVLVGLTSGYVAHSYAKYASEITGNQGTAKVAKWAFVTDNSSQTVTVDVTSTVNANSLVDKRIAPGTSGQFALQLTNGGTETGVAFTISFAATNAPKNLKLYKDSAHTNEIDFREGATVTGKLKAKDATGLEVPIYWQWAFGTSDEVTDQTNKDDTTDGTNANDMTLDVTIKGVQTDPTVDVATALD